MIFFALYLLVRLVAIVIIGATAVFFMILYLIGAVIVYVATSEHQSPNRRVSIPPQNPRMYHSDRR